MSEIVYSHQANLSDAEWKIVQRFRKLVELGFGELNITIHDGRVQPIVATDVTYLVEGDRLIRAKRKRKYQVK